MRTMAVCRFCIATVLLSFHAANSYILLTANLDDVHEIAKQIAESPVAGQLNKIIRRATSIFNQQFRSNGGDTRIYQRANDRLEERPEGEKDNSFEVWKPAIKGKEYNKIALRSRSSAEDSDGAGDLTDKKGNEVNKVERRHAEVKNDLAELGKNASFYLKSIKKIFENV